MGVLFRAGVVRRPVVSHASVQCRCDRRILFDHELRIGVGRVYGPALLVQRCESVQHNIVMVMVRSAFRMLINTCCGICRPGVTTLICHACLDTHPLTTAEGHLIEFKNTTP